MPGAPRSASQRGRLTMMRAAARRRWSSCSAGGCVAGRWPWEPQAPARALRRVDRRAQLLGVSARLPSRDEILAAHRRLVGDGPSRPRRQRRAQVARGRTRARDLLLRSKLPATATVQETRMSHQFRPHRPARIRHPRDHRRNARPRRRARDRPRLRAPCCAAPAASRWRSATTGGSARRCSSTRWSKG